LCVYACTRIRVYTCRKKEPENNKNKQRVGVITGILLEERQTLVG